MSARGNERVPVRLSFGPEDGRLDSWGRLEKLSAGGAKLSTLCELRARGLLRLCFEVNGERFTEIRARVAHSEPDLDGFFHADVDFVDPLDRRKLSKALLDLLSR